MISFFDTHGMWLWSVWYAVLWLAVVPFGVLLLYAVFRVTPQRSHEESTWLNGAVLASFVVLIVSSLLGAMLYVRAQPDRAWWTYLLWMGIHFVAWTFLGSGVFFASLQALGGGARVGLRRVMAVLSFVGALMFHLATLYATHVFRARQ